MGKGGGREEEREEERRRESGRGFSFVHLSICLKNWSLIYSAFPMYHKRFLVLKYDNHTQLVFIIPVDIALSVGLQQ